MEEKITQLVQYLNKLFWGVSLTSVLAGIIQLLVVPHNLIDEQTGIHLQTAAILVLLGCIPLSFKLYHKKLISDTLPDDMEIRISIIRKWFTIRLMLIITTFLFNIVVYSFTQSTSFLFCCGIVFMILFFFCRPNRDEITNILSKNNL